MLFAEPAIAAAVRPYVTVHTGRINAVGLWEQATLQKADQAALITIALGMWMELPEECVLPAFEHLAETRWADVVTEALLVYREEPDVPTALLKYGLMSALPS